MRMRLHHVQVSIPKGGEDGARRFYGAGLGIPEAAKPAELASRGGCWFRQLDGNAVTVEIHVGVEEHFVPASKAHPAFEVDRHELEPLGQRLTALGFDVDWSERSSFDGYERFHTRDAVGNRVEVLARL